MTCRQFTQAPLTKKQILPKGLVEAEARYRFAQGLIHQGKYENAVQAFREFIAAHPKDVLTPNARYWLGWTYYVLRKYRTAAEIFLKGFRADPKGNKAPDNLLSLGMSLSQMGKKADACAMFRKLTADFPDVPNFITQRLKGERASANCG